MILHFYMDFHLTEAGVSFVPKTARRERWLAPGMLYAEQLDTSVWLFDHHPNGSGGTLRIFTFSPEHVRLPAGIKDHVKRVVFEAYYDGWNLSRYFNHEYQEGDQLIDVASFQCLDRSGGIEDVVPMVRVTFTAPTIKGVIDMHRHFFLPDSPAKLPQGFAPYRYHSPAG